MGFHELYEKPVSDRILNEFEEQLKKYAEENKESLSNLSAFLNMIDPNHSIILNDTLGLLGNGPYNDYDKILILNNYSEVSNQPLRGNVYDVLTEKGLLFKNKVDQVGVLVENGSTVGYVFGLLDERATILFDSFFDIDDTVQAYILWDLKNLYVNNVVNDELKSNFIYEPTFEAGKLGVQFKGARYIFRKKLANNICVFNKSK